MPQTDKLTSAADLAGPSDDSFYVTLEMCEDEIESGLPRGTALMSGRKLPSVLRAIEAMEDVTVVVQSRGGATFTLVLAAGDVFDRGRIVAIAGLESDTALLGHV